MSAAVWGFVLGVVLFAIAMECRDLWRDKRP